MAKQHEILAVEGTLEKAVNKLIAESLRTLKKEALFSGLTRKLEMFREDDKNSEHTESQALTTTVDENIDYLTKPVADWLDVVLQKEITNGSAKADLVVDGNVLAKDVPATFLLGLETKLAKFREVYDAIPTLQPGVRWVQDPSQPKGVYVAAENAIQMKTRKEPEFRVVYEATKEHPAQIKEVERQTDVGRYVSTMYSGRMAPVEKAARLTRIDRLLAAVKQARMRANNIEVEKAEIGETILNYING